MIKMRKRARTIFVIGMLYLLITVCTSNWGQASFFQDAFSEHTAQTESTAHNEHGGSSLLGPLINFLVLFGGLTLVLRKPIAGFFKKYIQTVQKDLSEAAASRTTSEANLKQINARLKKMAKEADNIRAAAEVAGNADKERILASSRASAEKIKAKTAADIELISQFGAKTLKEFTVDLAVSRARANILRTLKPAAQPGLIDKSIERLERIHAKNGSA